MKSQLLYEGIDLHGYETMNLHARLWLGSTLWILTIEILKEFPILSKLDPAVYSPPESSITKELIEQELHGMSVDKAIEEKRLFILDFHDLLSPFIERMNNLPGTVFFYSKTGILTPIVIELSLPPTPSSSRNKYVHTCGHDATTHWIWKLAKAHVCSNDAGVHQLVNHCRGKYAMELSSWWFDMEALPADLIRSGGSFSARYAADGLLIWSAIKEWVEFYVEHFYTEPDSVTSDVELQAWWDEIKIKGHYDKRNEPWWPKLASKDDLWDILTTMIWTA
ncbi:hypothetical protein PTKIN_Ptkin17bG0099600 [Pterospermum kingtungense]